MIERTKVKVRFVKFDGEIVGCFLGKYAARRLSRSGWMRSAYCHLGQHCEVYAGMERRKRATEVEYISLLTEMTRCGYDVILV